MQQQTPGIDSEKKVRGRLNETLDKVLEPRLAPGKPGRKRGALNYKWTPEMDRVLVELCQRRGPATAKAMMGKILAQSCPRPDPPRPESIRKAVERRMKKLGLASGTPRKAPKEAVVRKVWKTTEVRSLVGALGNDLKPQSIVKRVRHTIDSVYAKLRRLGHAVEELRGIAFTWDELATLLNVTKRTIQRWREKGWLTSTRRRITDKDLGTFLKKHPTVISFEALPYRTRLFLMSLGYPAKETAKFSANVKSVLDGVAGRKERIHQRSNRAASNGKLATIFDKIERRQQLKRRGKQRPRTAGARSLGRLPSRSSPRKDPMPGGTGLFHGNEAVRRSTPLLELRH